MNEVLDRDLIALPQPNDALTVFTSDAGVDPFLDRIRKEIDGFRSDVSTATGRKQIASMAHKVAKAKAALEEVGKALADEQKLIPKKIDAARKKIKDTLDAWRDEVRKPLTEWEEVESNRVESHKAALSAISMLASDDIHVRSTDALCQRLAKAELVVIGSACDEFISEYAIAKDAAVRALQSAIEAAKKREAEAVELEKLRAEKAERDRKDNEERLRKEGEQRARDEAEADARVEKERADRNLADEKSAAERRERELIAEKEAAEQRAVNAAAKAKRELEDQKKAEAAETARREADKAHKRKINNAALAALIENGIDDASAKEAVKLIASKIIPAVTIHY